MLPGHSARMLTHLVASYRSKASTENTLHLSDYSVNDSCVAQGPLVLSIVGSYSPIFLKVFLVAKGGE